MRMRRETDRQQARPVNRVFSYKTLSSTSAVSDERHIASASNGQLSELGLGNWQFAISLQLVRGFEWNLAQIIAMWVGALEKILKDADQWVIVQ